MNMGPRKTRKSRYGKSLRKRQKRTSLARGRRFGASEEQSSGDIFKGGKDVRSRAPLLRQLPQTTESHRSELSQCSPYAFKHHIGNTCLTNDALQTIKMKSPETKLTSSTPQEMLHELYEKYPKCKLKEGKCLLHELSDKTLQKDLMKKLYRPKKPREWSDHPNEWLSNFDIERVLRQYEEADPTFVFLGVSPVDYDTKLDDGKCVHETICNFSKNIQNMMKDGKQTFAAVFNLSRHDQDGSHWVTLYISIPDNFIFYFDSTGDKPPIYIKRLIDNIKSQINLTYYESNVKHQKGNSECGMYALYFIVTMITKTNFLGCQDDDSKCQMEHKLNLFLHKPIKDEFVQQFRDKYFTP